MEHSRTNCYAFLIQIHAHASQYSQTSQSQAVPSQNITAHSNLCSGKIHVRHSRFRGNNDVAMPTLANADRLNSYLVLYDYSAVELV